MRLELNLDFEERFAADRFFFGVAYAPYCEGGGLNRPDGFKNTDWTRRPPGDTSDGEGIRFWTNYADHVRLAASLGLNAFRMGIEWARCQPSPSTEPTDPPEWDASALDHYADMVELVIDLGMQPIITLHHFTHPLWLGLDIWLEDRGPDQLVAAEIRIVDEINTRLMARGSKKMAHFLVYNEPNLVPLFYHSLGWYPVERVGPEYLLPAFDTMLSHYVKAYDGLHDLFETRGWGSPNVGYTIASLNPYEYDKQLDDLLRLRSWGVAREDAAAADRGVSSRMADADRRSGEVAADRRAVRALRRDGAHDRGAAAVRRVHQDAGRGVRVAPGGEARLPVAERLRAVRGCPPRTWGQDRRVKWERYMMDGEVYRTFILAKHDFNTDLPIYMGENSSGISSRQARPPTSAGRLVEGAVPQDVLDGDDPLHEGRRSDRGIPVLDAGRRRAAAAPGSLQLRLREPSHPRHGWLRSGVRQDLRASRGRTAERRQGDDLRRLRDRL